MKTCFECRATKDLQQHHVVPKSLGGTQTITLCYQCHMKAHGRNGKGANHSELTKAGIARRKKEGATWGAPPEKLRKAAKKGLETRRKNGLDNALTLALNIIKIKQEEGLEPKDISLRKMIVKLNSRGVTTGRGHSFKQPTQISQSLKLINIKLEDLK